MPEENSFEFKIELLFTTEKAWLIKELESEEEMWISPSIVSIHDALRGVYE